MPCAGRKGASEEGKTNEETVEGGQAFIAEGPNQGPHGTTKEKDFVSKKSRKPSAKSRGTRGENPICTTRGES